MTYGCSSLGLSSLKEESNSSLLSFLQEHCSFVLILPKLVPWIPEEEDETADYPKQG